MNIRSASLLSTGLSLLLSGALVQAQAVRNAPPPPPTDTEQQLAKVESVPQLLALGQKYDQAGDWRRYGYVMERVMKLRPHAFNIKYELAAARAMQKNATGAYDLLLKLKDQGLALKPWEDERFANINKTKAWDFIVEAFKLNAQPFGTGKVAFDLPKDDLLIECLAYDPKRKQFLAGTTRTGKVLKVDANGKTSEFISGNTENGLWSVLDMAVDAETDLLWVASSAVPHLKNVKPEDLGRAGVFKFELSSGKLLGRYLLTGNHTLTSIATGPNGDVYAAESDARAVYKLRDEKLELALANPNLTSVRGLAVSHDGTHLYLVDYENGIFGIDLDRGQAFELKGPPGLTQFGIEGLYWYEGRLIAVQNGTEPKRVMRLKLSDDGRRITSVQPLDANKPELVLPTRGAIANDKIYFIANTQRDQYDRYGIPRDAAKLKPTRIYQSDLRVGWDAEAPDMRPKAEKSDDSEKPEKSDKSE
jgi:hypothetical protein